LTYFVSDAAAADIQSMADEGRVRFGPVRTRSYLKGLTRTFQRIASFPQAYRERFEIFPPQRVCRYGAHLIFYVSEDAGVRILRIRHGREDWQDE